MTKYSKLILNLINSSSSHMTAEQIFFELKKTEPKIVLATVYNNLNSLYGSNLIRKISIEGAPDMYDKTVRHDHLFCRQCGKISDFKFEDLTDNLKRQLNDNLLSYDLRVFYICNECRNKI